MGALGAGTYRLGDPLDRALVGLSGANPLAPPVAAAHTDFPFPRSPLDRSLELESAHATVRADQALALADGLAREVGFWMMSTSGEGDLDAAERWLWENDRVGDLAAFWAWAVQRREIYIRDGIGRLSEGVSEAGPRYAARDEVVLLLAHTAWALDLRAEWITSPVHQLLVLQEPGGDRRVAVEATAFRTVTERGARIVSEEPSVGMLLTPPEEAYRNGTIGIRNPDPPWPGVYTAVTPQDLDGVLLGRLAARYDLPPTAIPLDGTVAAGQAHFQRALAVGVEAWEAGDLAHVREEAARAEGIRRDHPEWLRPARDEAVLTAIVRFADGDDAAGMQLVREVLAFNEPKGPVIVPNDDVHAAAMWLALEHGSLDLGAWNAQIVPLMNRDGDDPEKVKRLCEYGRRARRGTAERLVLSQCAEPGPDVTPETPTGSAPRP